MGDNTKQVIHDRVNTSDIKHKHVTHDSNKSWDKLHIDQGTGVRPTWQGMMYS